MPNMPDLQRNQRSGRENHQELPPKFLHVNADTFGKEDAAIKQRECARRAQCAARQHVLQFVQKKNDVPAVMQKQLVVCPVGDLIEPDRAAVQKQKRKAEEKQEHTFENFEDSDDFEITDATLLLQNLEFVRMSAHQFNPSLRFDYSATIGFSRQQISSLFPSGSSKKNP